MGPALPPTSPVVIRQLGIIAERLELQGVINTALATNPVAPARLYRDGLAAERKWATGFRMGPKTRGARDASRRSRANRRKH